MQSLSSLITIYSSALLSLAEKSDSREFENHQID